MDPRRGSSTDASQQSVASATSCVFQKQPVTLPDEFAEASAVAAQLNAYLNSDPVRADISRCHTLHASSQQIQAIVQPEA